MLALGFLIVCFVAFLGVFIVTVPFAFVEKALSRKKKVKTDRPIDDVDDIKCQYHLCDNLSAVVGNEIVGGPGYCDDHLNMPVELAHVKRKDKRMKEFDELYYCLESARRAK